jgi:hypothetical protein
MSVVGLLVVGELVEVMACPSIGDAMDTSEARATASTVLDRFLAGYWTPRTRANYRFIHPVVPSALSEQRSSILE